MMNSYTDAHEETSEVGEPCNRALRMHAQEPVEALDDEPYEYEYDGRDLDDLDEQY